MSRKHVSFSELKIWNECTHKHKLKYIDDVDGFLGNEHTAFGKAIHDVCEQLLVSSKRLDLKKLFSLNFLNELKDLEKKNVDLNKKLVQDMRKQGDSLVEYILPATKKYFGNFELISAEEELEETIEGSSLKYKGYIDLVVKTNDGKYHIVDWKTCSWGWDARRKADRMTTYQLTYYKYFFAKKHNIDPANIETHFALLKRTAKSNRAEFFKVSSGKKKIENALNLLHKALYNIERRISIKNRLACTRCEFFNTPHCR